MTDPADVAQQYRVQAKTTVDSYLAITRESPSAGMPLSSELAQITLAQ